MSDGGDEKDKVVKLKVVERPPPPPLPQPYGQHCAICFYWMPENPDEKQGVCRRFPPPTMLIRQRNDGSGEVSWNWMFPSMLRDAWCGEWKERPDPSEAPPETPGA